jgi:hypothetical protein
VEYWLKTRTTDASFGLTASQGRYFLRLGFQEDLRMLDWFLSDSHPASSPASARAADFLETVTKLFGQTSIAIGAVAGSTTNREPNDEMSVF